MIAALAARASGNKLFLESCVNEQEDHQTITHTQSRLSRTRKHVFQ